MKQTNQHRRLPFRSRIGMFFPTLFVLLLSITINGDNYNQWTYNKKLYLNTSSSGADVSGDVINFPVLVRLTSSNFTFGDALPNGEDIRFSKSDDTHLSYEIEDWNSGGNTAEIWVLVDTVFGNNDLQYIKMYWGKAGAADSSDANSVFSTSNYFVGVWHLNDDFNDATANGNMATNSGSDDVAGIIADGQSFIIANNDYIDIPTSASLDALTNLTGSCWALVDNNATANQAFISFHFSTTDRAYMWLDDNVNGIRCYNDINDAGGMEATTNYVPANGTWFHVAWVVDGSNWVIYINGAYDAGSNEALTLNDLDNGFLTQFGRRASYNDRYLGGDMDEVRISRTQRSAHWIKLCYQNQQATQTLVEMDIEKYDEWLYNKKLYINTTASGANVPGDVNNFPLLVRLHSSNFTFAQALSDGDDMRFAGSDGTHYSYELERWDNTNDSAELWVKVPTVYGNNSTQYINMYWGNTDAPDSSNANNVFETSNNFEGVWHLPDNDFTDATANANNGTNSGSANGSGAVGDGKSFTPNSYITITGVDNDISVTTGTFSAWINMASAILSDGAARGVMEIGDASSGNDVIALRKTNANQLVFRYRQGGASTNATITDISGYGNTWKHVVGVWDAANINIYEDGALAAGPVARGADITLANLDQAFIGSDAQAGQDQYFNGYLDEMRISSTNRSADWIKLSYETQKPNSDVSGEEDYNDWLYSTNIYINTTASGADVSDDVLDFPLLIRRDASNFNFSQAQSNGSDIRFSKADGSTPLSYEIERWSDALDSAEIWVQVDTIYGNNSTQYITMYWGNSSGVPDRSDGTEVFESGNYYTGVWHIHDDFLDASGSGYDGTNNGSTDFGGNIADGQDFDGVNDYINVGDIADRPNGSMSIWFMLDATHNASSPTTTPLWGKYQDGDYNCHMVFRGTDYIDGGSGVGTAGCIQAKIEYNQTRLYLATTTTTWTGGTWYHFVFTWDGSNGYIYVNGSQEDTRSITLTMGNTGNDEIGRTTIDVANVAGGPTRYINGKLDEPRMSTSARSVSWVKLSYETQKRNSSAMVQPIVWDGEGSDNNFSTAANWVGDVTPASTDDIIFNNTSTKACSLDISTTVDEITFSSGYTGAFYFTTDTLHTTGNVDFTTGGTVVPGTGALEFTGTSAQTFIPKAGQTFPEIIQNGSGGTTASSNTFTSNALTITSGSLDLSDAGLTHMACSLSTGGGSMDFGTSTLQITNGDADFSSLTTITAATGEITFTHASNTQVLTPMTGSTHPNINHTGAGTLQLAGNTVIALSFTQSNGILDFNNQNMQTSGSFTISGGDNTSLSGLAGRTITVGGNASLSGQSGSLLDLNTTATWHYWTVTGNLTANYADINYSNASGSTANGEAASNCNDGGINNSWTFDTEDYVNDWTYTKNIYFNTTPTGADVSGNVTDFPMLIRLTSSNFTFGQAENDGRDIRFAKSDGTPLSYEIEDWNFAGNTAEVWVLVDQVLGNNKSQYVKMYWGNGSVATKSDGSKVFQTSNNYGAVLHINDDFLDATSNNNDGTNNGSADAAAVISDGQYFDGGTDDIDLPVPSTSLNALDNMTVSMWAETDNYNTTYQTLMSFYSSGTDLTFFTLWDAIEGIAIYNDINNAGVYNPTTTWLPSNNTWYYYTWTIDGSNWRVYVDAVQKGTSSQTLTMNDLNDGFSSRIGRRAGTDDNEWLGTIDEVRISTSIRSTDWIKLCYETQKIGSEVVYFSESPVITGLSSAGLVSASQQDKDTVIVQYEVEDPNDATVTIALEYQLSGDSWTATANTSGDIGAGVDANSSSTDRTIKWDVRTNLGNNAEDDYYVRVIATDGSSNKDTTASAIFKIDTKKPTGLGNFSASDTTSSTITLGWSIASDPNFSHYEIWYGEIRNDVLNRTGGAIEWDYDNDGNLSSNTTSSTTITGLNTNTTYFLKIWSIDTMVNESTITDISIPTKDMAAPVWSKTSVGIVNGGAINDVDGTIYVGSGASTDRLSCYSLSNGASKWTYSTSSYGACNMPTYVYTGGSYKVLASAGDYVIGRQDNGSSSSELFTPIDLGSTAGNPYVSPDDLYFYVVYTDFLTKRNLSDGSEVWTQSITNATPDADIVVWNDVVYIATTAGVVHKRNASDGSPGQTYDAQNDIDLPLLVQDSVLYITPNNDTAYSISASNLTVENWKLPLGKNNTGAAFIAGGTDLYLAVTDSVKKVNVSTGTRTWAYKADSSISSGPIPSGSYIYFGCDNGSYYTINSSGTLVTKWPYTEASGNASTGPWIDATGKVVFGTTGGNLDAFALLVGEMRSAPVVKELNNIQKIEIKQVVQPKLNTKLKPKVKPNLKRKIK